MDFDEFMKEIYVTRKRGFAVDMEESESGLFCVGTPLTSSKHSAIGAISLSTNRMTDADLQKISKGLLSQTLAKRLSVIDGYSNLCIDREIAFPFTPGKNSSGII